MGATYVTVTIRNPADPDRCWEGLFLVDKGAIDSLVPGPHLDAIGLKPKGKRIYQLADGNEIAMDITTADIEFMGDLVGGTILYGAPDTEPLLGVTALESVGIEVDPVSQRLKSWDPRGAGALTRKELGVLAAHVGLRHVVGVSAACRRSMNSVA